MITKTILEINEKEKSVLIDALDVYHRYLIDIANNQELKGTIKSIHNDTLIRTEEMMEQIRG